MTQDQYTTKEKIQTSNSKKTNLNRNIDTSEIFKSINCQSNQVT